MRVQQSFPSKMLASTSSSKFSSTKSDDGNAMINGDSSYGMQRWLGDVEGDRVAGRHIMPGSKSKHSSAASSIRKQQSSIRKLESNKQSREETCCQDLAGVGSWCHSEQLRQVNLARSQGYRC